MSLLSNLAIMASLQILRGWARKSYLLLHTLGEMFLENSA